MNRIVLLMISVLFIVVFSSNDCLAKAKIGIPGLENKARLDRTTADSLVDMLVTAFVKAKKFDVMERSSLLAIAEEQMLGASGLVDPEGAAKIGKLGGVQFMVVGVITQCGYSKKETKAFGITGGQTTAHIGLDIRLVDTNTGQIMLAESFTKSKTAVGISTGGLRVDLAKGPISELAREVCNEIVREVMFTVYPPKVIKVSNDKVTINYGESVISVDEVFEVYSLGEELIDPDTGESLGADEELVGTIKITKTTAKISIGIIIDSNGDIGTGMVLRPKVTKKEKKKDSIVPW